MSVMGMGVLAYCATFVALMICAAGQTVHGYLRVVHSTSRARALGAGLFQGADCQFPYAQL